MLLEQNAALQRTLHEVQNELRTLRAHELGARLRDGLNARSLRDTAIQELHAQRDAALAAGRQAETAMQALRNVNQRLRVENRRLIAADAPEPPGQPQPPASRPALERPAVDRPLTDTPGSLEPGGRNRYGSDRMTG
ncbi:hypothetical protein ACFVHS_44725 [Streptomyces sp. NPDC057746]|uniref:hypothetical protein n=1 Tax=Streptomyces sp. NPDC057746 TaxID=3346237 RepID=UPI0036821130